MWCSYHSSTCLVSPCHQYVFLWFSLACLIKPLVEPAAQVCVVNRFWAQSHSQLFGQHFYCGKLKGWTHMIIVQKKKTPKKPNTVSVLISKCSVEKAAWLERPSAQVITHSHTGGRMPKTLLLLFYPVKSIQISQYLHFNPNSQRVLLFLFNHSLAFISQLPAEGKMQKNR